MQSSRAATAATSSICFLFLFFFFFWFEFCCVLFIFASLLPCFELEKYGIEYALGIRNARCQRFEMRILVMRPACGPLVVFVRLLRKLYIKRKKKDENPFRF